MRAPKTKMSNEIPCVHRVHRYHNVCTRQPNCALQVQGAPLINLVRTFPRPGARFLELNFYHYYISGGCMAKIPGAEYLGEVHPVGAQNKTLISDTAFT